jgi:hypothetical protein
MGVDDDGWMGATVGQSCNRSEKSEQMTKSRVWVCATSFISSLCKYICTSKRKLGLRLKRKAKSRQTSGIEQLSDCNLL